MTDSDRYLSYVNQRLDCARLLHAAPERVFDTFRAAADKGGYFCDPDIEVALLSRNDPQINLALAAYGENGTVVGALYQASTSQLAVARASGHKDSPLSLTGTSVDAQYERELRQACLSNRRASRFVPDLASYLSRKGQDIVTSLLAEGHDTAIDLSILLRNPTVGDELLANLFKRTNTFDRLDDEVWRRLVSWASDNPRLAEPSRDSPDGPDLAAWDIADGIEHLLNTEPPTDESERDYWAIAVSTVLETAHSSLRPRSVNVLQILVKWPDARPHQDTDGGNANYRRLSDSGDNQRELCYLIAALFGAGPAENGSADNAPDDWMAQLRRCAHYGRDRLSIEDLDNGHAKDGDAFVTAVLCNDSVLINNELRGHLASVCYLRRSDDEPGSELNIRLQILVARDRYEYRCQQLQKDHPWVQADTPDTSEADLESPSAPQRSTQASLDDLSKSIAHSMKSFKWWVILGFIVVILVLLFRQ